MLTVGIPAYRLPRDIINAEFDALVNCGVEIVNNVTIGKDKTLKQLKDEGYDAVFVGIGAHASRKLGVEGEDLDGIPFKLSDYRGKVVMLDFYGDW